MRLDSIAVAFLIEQALSVFGVLDYAVHDFGDLSFHHVEKDEPYMDVKFPRTVGAANKTLSGAVSRAVGAGHTLVMLGGDHR